jgi:hypothetical protein
MNPDLLLPPYRAVYDRTVQMLIDAHLPEEDAKLFAWERVTVLAASERKFHRHWEPPSNLVVLDLPSRDVH